MGSTSEQVVPSGSGGEWRGRFEARAKALSETALTALVRSRSDRQIERTIGSRVGLMVIFKAMERAFIPERADGFEGKVQYVLATHDGSESRAWYLTIDKRRARARKGVVADPDVTFKASVSTFARIVAKQAHPAQEMLKGRFYVEGNFELAMRLGAMFGDESLIG